MIYKVIRRVVSISLLTIVAALVLIGQDYKSLLGKWQMTSETDGDNVKWALVLKETDGKLTATLAADQGEVPAKDFVYADGVMKFKAPYQDDYYDIELKVTGDKLVGTWSGGGNSGRTTGEKM
jgi:hypothetical protein